MCTKFLQPENVDTKTSKRGRIRLWIRNTDKNSVPVHAEPFSFLFDKIMILIIHFKINFLKNFQIHSAGEGGLQLCQRKHLPGTKNLQKEESTFGLFGFSIYNN
jgi:hypothetical protein